MSQCIGEESGTPINESDEAHRSARSQPDQLWFGHRSPLFYGRERERDRLIRVVVALDLALVLVFTDLGFGALMMSLVRGARLLDSSLEPDPLEDPLEDPLSPLVASSSRSASSLVRRDFAGSNSLA